MKALIRFLGTMAGGLIALLTFRGIIATSLIDVLIVAVVIAVIWLFIPPIGRLISPLVDALIMGIPGILLDAVVLTVFSHILSGLHIVHFGWALLAAFFILIGRQIGTGIVKNINNPDGLSIFGPLDDAEELAGAEETLALLGETDETLDPALADGEETIGEAQEGASESTEQSEAEANKAAEASADKPADESEAQPVQPEAAPQPETT